MQARLDEEPFPIVFADMRQVLAARARMPKELQLGQGLSGFPTLAVRARTDWRPIAAELRRIVRDVDPGVGADSIAALDNLRDGSLVRPRFYAVLVGLFAAIAGIIAAVGDLRACSPTPSSSGRTRSACAWRSARGAAPSSQRSCVRASSSPALGVVLGLAGALAVTRSLATMLYGLSPLDPGTFAGVAIALVSVARARRGDCPRAARRASTRSWRCGVSSDHQRAHEITNETRSRKQDVKRQIGRPKSDFVSLRLFVMSCSCSCD